MSRGIRGRCRDLSPRLLTEAKIMEEMEEGEVKEENGKNGGEEDGCEREER